MLERWISQLFYSLKLAPGLANQSRPVVKKDFCLFRIISLSCERGTGASLNSFFSAARSGRTIWELGLPSARQSAGIPGKIVNTLSDSNPKR
jgi:hypothetical protein